MKNLKNSHKTFFNKQAREAPNGRSKDASLIFLNLGLPDAGGIAALRRIKKEYPSTAVVVINAGAADGKFGDAFREAPWDSAHRGPIKPDEILQQIKELLDTSEVSRRRPGLLITNETLRERRYPDVPPQMLEGILRVRDFIDRNHSESLSLAAACKMASLCKTYFCRFFRRVTGHTLRSYHHAVKIRKAEELLRDKRHSIKEIAFRLGYTDSNYFSTVYKKFTGESPRQHQASAENVRKLAWSSGHGKRRQNPVKVS